MYTPPSFLQTDLEKLHAFIDEHSFATLISQADGEPVATHLPLLLDRGRNSPGSLIGHLARANPQWQSVTDQRVLTIFHGPHAYISPSWYAADNVVPTWNYLAVHVYGSFRLIPDSDRLRELLQRMVERYESRQIRPWKMESQDETFLSRMRQAIVGFEIEIERIEGKWKLSQNHPQERRENVAEKLIESNDPDARQIAMLMRST
jgi:transcriptional regulator